MFFVKHGAITKDKKEFVFIFKRGSEVGFLSIKINQVLKSFEPVLVFAEKYLQECWPIVKGALKEHGIACELNLVSISIFLSSI